MVKTKVGVVGIPGGWSSQRLVHAFAERGCDAHLIDMRDVVQDLESRSTRCGALVLDTLDAIAIKKIGSPYSPDLLNRLAMLRFVAKSGVPVYSDPFRIKRVIDRLSCTVTLRLHDIPMPATTITENVNLAVDAVERYGRAVLKPLYTSKARGMVVLHAGGGARETVEKFQAAGNRTIYVQELLPLVDRDFGLVFLGGAFLGGYARVRGKTAWNTTTRSGGRYERYEPPSEIIALARRAQAPFELAFTCVDVALTDDGPIVFEVSAFGGFRGLWDAGGMNAAVHYADYILDKVGHGRSVAAH